MISILISLFLTLYIVWLVVMQVAWLKLTQKTSPKVESKPKLRYSIIIPARNETDTIERVISAIKRNEFPRSNYEVILVDDHSEDDTYEKAQQFGNDIICVRLQENSGKKAALATGIDIAQGDVIITTDADCIVSGKWLSSIANFFEGGEVKLLSGAVGFNPLPKIFDKLQAIEFSSLVGVGASSIYLRKPGMCNGANLAFLKAAYKEVGGYSDNLDIASGDDEFLMHKIANYDPHSIYFNINPDGVVYTNAQSNLNHFIQQRKRWASKWTRYKDWRQSLLAVFIGLSNVAVLAGIWHAILGDFTIMILLFLKLVLELTYLKSVLMFLNTKVSWVYFILIQIIYPFYVVYFVVVANLVGYKWKGRSY
ncbi:MAG: glycosyltransferase [Bacteroidota bacterium]